MGRAAASMMPRHLHDRTKRKQAKMVIPLSFFHSPAAGVSSELEMASAELERAQERLEALERERITLAERKVSGALAVTTPLYTPLPHRAAAGWRSAMDMAAQLHHSACLRTTTEVWAACTCLQPIPHLLPWPIQLQPWSAHPHLLPPSCCSSASAGGGHGRHHHRCC